MGVCCLLATGCSGETANSGDAAAAAEQPAAGQRVVGQPSAATVTGTAAPGTIVTLEPATSREFAPPATVSVMDQYGQQFLPGLLVAQVGQQVEFRSSEDVLHNVRVDESGTKAPIFNVATPPFGNYTHVFDKPGYYNVSCDVHPSMRANIFVGASPYIAVADASGAFSIANVEPGQYTAMAVSDGATTDRTIDVVAPKTQVTFTAR
jgi:plastocyanin